MADGATSSIAEKVQTAERAATPSERSSVGQPPMAPDHACITTSHRVARIVTPGRAAS